VILKVKAVETWLCKHFRSVYTVSSNKLNYAVV